MEITVAIISKDDRYTLEKCVVSFNKAVALLKSNQNVNRIRKILVTPKYKKFSNLEIFTDKGNGKINAINDLFKKINSDYTVLIDGDTLIDQNLFNNIVNYIIKNDLSIATGKILPLNSRDTLYGFWAWELFDANANRLRRNQEKLRINGILNHSNKFFPASGYIMAIRNRDYMPIKSSIIEDSEISKNFFNRGFMIGYDETSICYVKFPTNLADIIKQKKRTIGGNIKEDIKGKGEEKISKRNFAQEIIDGIIPTIMYVRSIKEFFYLILLLLFRLYIWIYLFIYLKVLRNNLKWETVKSSKL